MSVQLQFFPTATTITTSGFQQKFGKWKAGEGQQEHSGTVVKTQSKQSQQIIYSGQISTPVSSPISPSSTFAQSPKPVPSITVPGSLKRIRPPEMASTKWKKKRLAPLKFILVVLGYIIEFRHYFPNGLWMDDWNDLDLFIWKGKNFESTKTTDNFSISLII